MFKRKKKEDGQPDVELPITPMLDMAFQLLTFFIFTYNPGGLEGHLDLTLPASTGQEPPIANVEPPAAEPALAPAVVKIRLHTLHDGVNNGALAYPIELDEFVGRQIFGDLETLTRELKKRGDVRRIDLSCEDGLKWEGVISVMEACRAGGVNNIGFTNG